MTSKKNPRLQQEDSLLSLANIEDGKTDKDKADLFMSKFMEYVKPFDRYKEYLENSWLGAEVVLANVKRFYQLKVIEEGIKEVEYVKAIHRIFTDKQVLDKDSLNLALRINGRR